MKTSTYDRPVLRTRDVSRAELKPGNDVGVGDVPLALHPELERVLRRGGSLRRELAGGEKLPVDVGGGPDRVLGESGAAADERVVVRKKRRRVLAHDLVADRGARAVVRLVRVDHRPHATGVLVGVACALCGRLELLLDRVETVSGPVLLRTGWFGHGVDFRLDDRVVDAAGEKKGIEMPVSEWEKRRENGQSSVRTHSIIGSTRKQNRCWWW